MFPNERTKNQHMDMVGRTPTVIEMRENTSGDENKEEAGSGSKMRMNAGGMEEYIPDNAKKSVTYRLTPRSLK